MDEQIVPRRRRAGSGASTPEGATFGEQPVFEVGNIGPASTTTQAALRRYLLTRSLGSSVVNTVQGTGVAVLILAALCWLGGLKVLAVLVGFFALLIFALRAMLSAIQRRLAGSDKLGPLEPRVAALVARTRRGLRRELRRVGLPGVPWAPLLIALRLMRPAHRARTVQALSRIDLTKVVPPSQLDELQILLRQMPPGRF